MSNLNYTSQFSYSFAGQHVKLFAKVTIGATGAPTLVAGTGRGISSITRNSAGNYTIALSNPFNSLMGLHVVSKNGTTAPAAPVVTIDSDSSVNSVSAPSFSIQCWAPTSSSVTTLVATDPGNGEELYIVIDLNRSQLSN